MPKVAWVNGSFVDPREPVFGVRERGFLYGEGLFETIKICNFLPLYWEEHRARLFHGCTVLNISPPRDEINTGVMKTARVLESGVLRLTVTGGETSGRGLIAARSETATAVITGFTGEPYAKQLYEKGFEACLISFPRSQNSPLVKLKTISCLEIICGRKEAKAHGADEGLFVNYRGEITESTTSNVFLVIQGRLVTPPLECGLLPGIMRDRVLLLAAKLGLAVTQEILYPRDFDRAQESFLTNAVIGVMPLITFEGKPVGNGRPGKLTQTLSRELQMAVP